VTTFKILTPLVDVPASTKFDASTDPGDYDFYDSFAP